MRPGPGGSDMTHVRALSAGAAHTCALKTDGTVWCWGFALFGQMGDGTVGDGLKQLTPAHVRRSNGVLPGAHSLPPAEHTCALRDDGTVWCWGPMTSARSVTAPWARSQPRPARRLEGPAGGGFLTVPHG